jgi:hypothetical protein
LQKESGQNEDRAGDGHEFIKAFLVADFFGFWPCAGAFENDGAGIVKIRLGEAEVEDDGNADDVQHQPDSVEQCRIHFGHPPAGFFFASDFLIASLNGMFSILKSSADGPGLLDLGLAGFLGMAFQYSQFAGIAAKGRTFGLNRTATYDYNRKPCRAAGFFVPI